MRYRAKRRDANELAIVEALERVGATVTRLNEPEPGVPDLLVGFRGETFLLEVKSPDAKGGAKPGGKRVKGRGALTPAQVAWRTWWRGSRVQDVVSAGEALLAIGALQ